MQRIQHKYSSKPPNKCMHLRTNFVQLPLSKSGSAVSATHTHMKTYFSASRQAPFSLEPSERTVKQINSLGIKCDSTARKLSNLYTRLQEMQDRQSLISLARNLESVKITRRMLDWHAILVSAQFSKCSKLYAEQTETAGLLAANNAHREDPTLLRELVDRDGEIQSANQQLGVKIKDFQDSLHDAQVEIQSRKEVIELAKFALTPLPRAKPPTPDLLLHPPASSTSR